MLSLLITVNKFAQIAILLSILNEFANFAILLSILNKFAEILLFCAYTQWICTNFMVGVSGRYPRSCSSPFRLRLCGQPSLCQAVCSSRGYDE